MRSEIYQLIQLGNSSQAFDGKLAQIRQVNEEVVYILRDFWFETLDSRTPHVIEGGNVVLIMVKLFGNVPVLRLYYTQGM